MRRVSKIKNKIKRNIPYLKEMSVRNKIIIYIFASMLMSLTIFGSFMYVRMYNKMLENTYSNISLMINNTSKNLNDSFNIINYTTLGLTSSNTVKEWITDPEYFHENSEEAYLKDNMFDSELRRSLLFNNAWNLKLISTVSTYVNEKGVSYIFTKEMPIEKFKITSDKIFENIKDKAGEYIFDVPPTICDNNIYHIRRLKNPHNKKESITFIVATSEDLIADKFEDLKAYNNSNIYIYDKSGIVLSSTDKSILGKRINDNIIKNADFKEIKEVNIEKKNYIVGYKTIESNGLTLVMAVPREKVVSNIFESMNYFITFSLFLIIILTTIVVMFMLRSTKFIKDLLVCINNIKNKKYNTKMPTYKDDSLNELSSAVNSMTDELNYLIKETYEKQLLIKEMNIKFLQYQMNPHFLFNVLITIQMKAKMCKDESIYKMVNALTILLRAGIYTDSTAKVKLKQELEYVEFYLYLQQVRFEERLEYKINIEEEDMLELSIPKLTIEPIVENAIIHGLEETIGTLIVEVNVFRVKDSICIEIKDNGIGFDVNKVINETEDDVTKRNTQRDKVGLKNTDQRLKLIYGQDYGLKIDSVINKGTNIKVIIPLDYNK
ncbi:two-component system, sensor histidine kinase YesM [Clostridium cavendishii DSM 21758]|uniref:Two-component system, sensor histidine kinase YesM n=1 Tax=Clostridium cavendishii DSM 21758 TaxID=1121302 RepID=A0A1M6GVD1_9CLOT|nr:histidine kinase [Clostridium cavendishii]SHJ13923.1 two-component system, sensor histidine kinase YesM [Clostridium cavendishii DSM 21758]